jgi:hypothetical protein
MTMSPEGDLWEILMTDEIEEEEPKVEVEKFTLVCYFNSPKISL